MPLDVVLTGDTTVRLEQALGTLSDREAEILRLRFGVGEVAEHTLEEVGRRFGVTRERIRLSSPASGGVPSPRFDRLVPLR